MKRPVITGTERERKDWKANSTTALYFFLWWFKWLTIGCVADLKATMIQRLRKNFIPDVSIKRRMNKNQNILNKVLIEAPTTVTKWKLNLTRL